MSSLWQRVEEKLDRAEHNVALVPASLFYCRFFELPEGATADEIPAFAELNLETHAPFDIDHLSWGYLHGKRDNILIYAAYKPRLRNLGYDELDNFERVLPSFVPALDRTFEKATILFVLQSGDLTALSFAPGEEVPREVASATLAPESEPREALEEARRNVLARISTEDRDILDQVRLGQDARLEPDRSARFQLRSMNFAECALFLAGEAEEVGTAEEVTEGSLLVDPWAADFRDNKVIRGVQRNRKLSGIVWGSTLAAILLFALLLFALFGLVGGKVWNGQRNATAELQQPEVTDLQNKFELANRIQTLITREKKPIEMLKALEPARPENIFYTSMDVDEFNQIRVAGESPTQREANQFRNRLRDLPGTASADLTEIETRNGRTTFELTVSFEPDRFGDPTSIASSAQP